MYSVHVHVCVVIKCCVVSEGAHQEHARQAQRTSARYCLNRHILGNNIHHVVMSTDFQGAI